MPPRLPPCRGAKPSTVDASSKTKPRETVFAVTPCGAFSTARCRMNTGHACPARSVCRNADVHADLTGAGRDGDNPSPSSNGKASARPPGLVYFGHNALRPIGVKIIHCNGRALSGDRSRNARADVLTGSSDQRDTSRQVEHFTCIPSRLGCGWDDQAARAGSEICALRH